MNPNRATIPNKRSRDLMNRLIPKQQIHNHPVTLGATIGKNAKPIIRGAPIINPKIKKLPPLPEKIPDKKESSRDIDSDEPLPSIDYETLTDPFDFIEKVKERNDTRSFVYLYPSNILEDADHPTCLRIIPQEQSSREEFWNLSLNGLTHVKSSTVDFIPLKDWIHDLNLFSKIMTIPFFKYQRQWRAFKLWKKAVRSDKMTNARTSLTGSLFFSHSVLRPAFIKIQRELQELQKTKLFSIRPDGLYTISSFLQENEQYRETVAKKFDDFFMDTLQIVQDACEKTIDILNSGEAEHQVKENTEEGSVLDQWIAQYNRIQKHGQNATVENGPSLVFTKKASHHAVCQKLVRFIRLIDYLIISSLRRICFTSLLDMHSILLTLQDRGVNKIGYKDPSPVEPLILPNEYQKIYSVIRKQTNEIFEQPIFQIDVTYKDKLVWKPTKEEIIGTIDSVRNDFIHLLFQVPRLIANPIFKQYIVEDISLDRVAQEKMSAPDLGQIIFNDQIYKETVKKGSEIVSHGFDLLEYYSIQFQKAINIYNENCRFKIDFLDSNEITVVDVKIKIKEYHEQEAFLRTVVDKSEVGLYQIFLKQMKSLFIKSPGNCLSQIKKRIPTVARRFLESFSEKVKKAHEELTTVIDGVDSFVKYIHAVTRQHEALPELQRLADVIKGFQQLASEQGVFINNDEISEYQELIPIFDEVKRSLAFSSEQKATLTPKYTSSLEKSIAQLHSAVLDATELANDDRLSNIKTKPNRAATLLVVIIAKTDEIRTLAQNYNYYQSSMNLTVTKFDDVDSLVNDVYYKQLLWETKTEWMTMTKNWFQQTFKSIDPSALSGQLNDFQDRSLRAQMGLPNNEVADELRASISDFSNLLPIVSDLKNPALTQVHIDQITNLLGGDIFGDDEFRFGRLVDLQAYNFVDQISAISAQATNEHALQDMLNSVKNILDNLQYTLNPCKFQKNTYTLEGTEEILAQLDDAQATINSVRASKYIAPLRSSADEMMKNLRQVQYIVTLLDQVQSKWSYVSQIFQTGDISRQLQSDTKELQSVDKIWRNVSLKLNDDPSLFFRTTNNNNNSGSSNNNVGSQTIPDLENANVTLEKIQKSLEDFLEQKRIAFPRLYFLSNDELLDLISKSKDPNCIQPYLPKLFDGVYSIETALENHIPCAMAVFSNNGEKLNLRPVKFRVNIELWLLSIEEQIIRTLKNEMKNAKVKFHEMVREDWISIQHAQIAAAITQAEWTSRIELCFPSQNQIQQLTLLKAEVDLKISNLVKLARLDLREGERSKIASLIILDSHVRDVIQNLIDKNIIESTNFEWTKNFMLKWDDQAKEILVTQLNNVYKYGYELIGNHQRLIITPEYLNCQNSLFITLAKNYGGCLIGPSCVGKTEIIRDVARSMGMFCYLVNCSPSITTLQMALFLRGIVQSGVWCCFQEIQRLPNETLSVADLHLNLIRQASVGGLKKFFFDSYEIPLSQSYCIFATLSSTDAMSIPQPLKDYFRPVSMKEVDERKVIEITFVTLGFEGYSKLTKTFLRFIFYCRNILAKQPHYDFSIRTMKKILYCASVHLHNDEASLSESLHVSNAINEVLLPMLNSTDKSTFNSFLSELYPPESLVSSRTSRITATFQDVCEKNNLQTMPYTLNKVTQLHNIYKNQSSIILVGQTGSGKTTSLDILEYAYNVLSQQSDNDQFCPVKRTTICPNTLTFDELYGTQNLETGIFKLGIIESIFDNKSSNNSNNIRKEEWIVFDGQIRPNWIENLNTVLDDNKVLSLANAKTIKMSPFLHVFFEVPDLAEASPATLTRSSIIYFETSQLGWQPLLITQCQKNVYPLFLNNQNFIEKFNDLTNVSISQAVEFLSENESHLPSSTLSYIDSLVNIFVTLMNGQELNEKDGTHIITALYVFAFIWSFGGHLEENKRALFDSFVRDIFSGHLTLPNKGLVYDWKVDPAKGEWSHWSEYMPKFVTIAPENFEVDPLASACIFCHTIETYRISYILKLLLKSNTNVVLSGHSGSGKTTVVNRLMKEMEDEDNEFGHFSLEFSSKTTSQTAQKLIEMYLEKKHGDFLRPICDKNSVFCIDNINFGQNDSFELLRQILSFQGLFRKPSYQWMAVKKFALLGISGQIQGTSRQLPPRLLRHVLTLEMAPFDSSTSYQVVHSILQLFFMKFNETVVSAEPRISNSIISIFESVSTSFPQSLDNPHFNFNFRDVIRVVQGLLLSTPETIPDSKQFERLWAHEVTRVFSDRFNNEEDSKKFDEILTNCIKKKLNSEQPVTAFHTYFGDLSFQQPSNNEKKTDEDAPLHKYNEYETLDDVIDALEEPAREFFASLKSSSSVPILMFDFCAQHVLRLLRIIKFKQSHAILLGNPGTGRRTVVRFAAYLSQYDVVEFDNIYTLHEDFKSVCLRCGVNGKNTLLIVGDEAMKNDQFMNDLSSLMNGCDITTMFSSEDVDKICTDSVFFAKLTGQNESHQNLINLFLQRIRDLIHVVFCVSPYDFNMKDRFVNYPSIIKFSTFDYYEPWPDDAFTKVASSLFDDENMSNLSVSIHQLAFNVSQKFFNQTGKKYFVTPGLFIRFIENYKSTVDTRTTAVNDEIFDLDSSLEKISFTGSSLGSMETNLTDIEPELKSKTQQADILHQEISETEALLNKLKSAISKKEEKIREKTESIEKIKEECEKDLEEVQPALENAITALKGLNRGDISELRSFQEPPPAVRTVMEVVCILMETETTWKAASGILADPLFINKISTRYNEERRIPMAIMKKVQPYIESNPNFQESEVGRVSVAAKCLCVWATSLYNYEINYRKVEPKQEDIKAIDSSLKKDKDKLKKELSQAKTLEDTLDELKQQYDIINREKKKLNDNMNESKSRVGHASKLSKILVADQKKWLERMKKLKDSKQYIQGDSFLCAALLTYFGPLPSTFRTDLFNGILEAVNSAKFKVTPNFQFTKVMAEPMEIQEWLNFGLPGDQTSIENAIILRDSVMAPLIVDQLGFANQFIKQLEKTRQIVIVKPNTANLLKTIETSMRLGIPVLIEDVSDSIDPQLDNLVAHRIIQQDGKNFIKLSERLIEFDENFKLYMTTKVKEPKFAPETYSSSTIVDFSITKAALVAYETSNIIEVEDPELENNKKEVVSQLIAAKTNLKQIEERMLELLRSSGDHILDDEVLINTMESSESKRKEIEESLFKMETENDKFTKERSKYTPIAERLAVIFFSLSPLSNLNPLYVFSLEFIQKVALLSLKRFDSKEDRIPKLVNVITSSIFVEIARGIHSSHRLTLAFIMTSAILRSEKKISESEWSIFMRGLPKIENPLDNPIEDKIPKDLWDSINSLSRSVSAFRSLPNKILTDPDQFVTFVNSEMNEIPTVFGGKLDDLQKLLFVKTVAPEKLANFVKNFVDKNLGSFFTKPIVSHLKFANAFTSPNIPLMIILASDQVDARQKVLKFAQQCQMIEKMKIRAMSFSEALKTEKELHSCASQGEWILLENIECSGKWVNDFCATVSKICSGSIHPDFRVFLTTRLDSKTKLPIEIPLNCSKMILENNENVRADLLTCFALLSDEFFQSETAIRLSFSIGLFHSIILQRQKYGSVGFNCPYDFTDNEFRLISTVIQPYLENDVDSIPFNYLCFVIGDVIYGGRSNDDNDKKVINAILRRIVCKEAVRGENDGQNNIEENSITPLFVLPNIETKRQLLSFILSLPENDSPSLFGLHEGIQKIFNMKNSELASKSIKKAICNQVVSQEEIDEVVLDRVKNISSSLPELEDIGSNEEAETINFSDPLTIILTQETTKLAKTIEVIKKSINEIEKVIRGLIQSTEKVQKNIHSIWKGKVPKNWQNFKGYFTIDGFIKEIVKRAEFFNSWVRRGKPVLIDLSCFADPRNFLNAVVIHHIRSSQLQTDEVPDKVAFETRIVVDEPDKQPDEGFYVIGLTFQGAVFDMNQQLLIEEENFRASSVRPQKASVSNLRVSPTIADVSPSLFTFPKHESGPNQAENEENNANSVNENSNNENESANNADATNNENENKNDNKAEDNNKNEGKTEGNNENEKENGNKDENNDVNEIKAEGNDNDENNNNENDSKDAVNDENEHEIVQEEIVDDYDSDDEEEDAETSEIVDFKEKYRCPILQIIPVLKSDEDSESENGFFQCPVYQVINDPSKVHRKHVSNELITTLPIPTNRTNDFWIIRGASLHSSYE